MQFLPVFSLSFSRKKFALTLLFFVCLNLFSAVLSGYVHAAALTEAAIRLDRMGSAIAANTTTAKILIIAKPATTATEASVKITWPTTNAFTVSGTAGNHTVSTSSLPSTFQGETVTAWPGITTASAVSGGDVTFPSSDLTPGTLYGFFVTGGITNPASGDAGTHLVTIATQTSAPATIDSTQVAVDTLSSSTADEVTVTATVPPSFNFTMSDTTLALGTLSTGSVSTNAMSPGIDVDTNASNGYAVWIRSEGAAATLASASTGGSISSTNTGSVVTCSAGSNCYVVDIATSQGGASTGSLAPTSEFDGNGTTSGGVISTTYEEVANSTGQADSDTITPTVIVAISPVTKAATDYTDTWDVVGAGNF